MKEIKGLEVQNTFIQEDQYESQRLKGAKNRFIYDFSYSAQNLAPYANAINSNVGNLGYGMKGEPGSNSAWIIKDYPFNNIANSEGPDPRFFPEYANKRPIIFGEPIRANNYGPPVGSQNYTSDFKLDFDNSGINLVPKIEENVAVYLDNNTGGSFAQAHSVNFFRSGYFEISFKTTKQNCILAHGSAEVQPAMYIGAFAENGRIVGGSVSAGYYGTTSASIFEINDTAYEPAIPAQIHDDYYLSKEPMSTINKLQLRVKNGKLCLEYEDKYGDNSTSFEIIGNQNVADGEWHHVVINFARPGLFRNKSKKFNKKAIEFWIDSKLDIRSFDFINEKPIFFPVFTWLAVDIVNLVRNLVTKEEIYQSFDTNAYQSWSLVSDIASGFIGGSEFLGTTQNMPGESQGNLYQTKNRFMTGDWPEDTLVDAFNGLIRTVAIGINHPLTSDEISMRYKLWNGNESVPQKVFYAQASIVDPIITVNKKRILKLFWNDYNNLKNGLELDNNFIVDSYSVINKNYRTCSETFNNDIANQKTINVLKNVKVAFNTNVLIWGPGLLSLSNTSEIMSSGQNLSYSGHSSQSNGLSRRYDTVVAVDNSYTQKRPGDSWVGPLLDMKYSGIELSSGDRVLLTNQFREQDNGIWEFNGPDKIMTRPSDADSPEKINNAVVYVTDGYNKNTYWQMISTITSLNDSQEWIKILGLDITNINQLPILKSMWSDEFGNERFIDLTTDIDINIYDSIVFMNYPENTNEISQYLSQYDDLEINKIYNDFIESIKIVVSNGARLYVSSPKLAEDLGIVKKYSTVSQELENSDARSAEINPFQFDEPAERYFDTHRNNVYHLTTEVTGLTDKETWILTDFINYLPEKAYDYDEYHAKYSYRQFGLQEGNEFMIPSLALRKIQENKNIPGYRKNYRGTDSILAVAPEDVLCGTVITKLSNTYYDGNEVINNQYDDYATTIIVHDGQLLGNYPINGKIFINCVEDGYTMSREEYNKAIIQIIPENELNESSETRLWQYSTSRLNRLPRKVSQIELTKLGQTTPTNGGGGPLIQGPTNSSNGIIRSESDKNNINYQSDLYTKEEEEMYEIQEIPVLSMTWLGLQWLAE